MANLYNHIQEDFKVHNISKGAVKSVPYPLDRGYSFHSVFRFVR